MAGWLSPAPLPALGASAHRHAPPSRQVIAILDYDILRQLVGGAEYHKERCAEAV